MRRLFCALAALISVTASAKVTLPKFFADNMVLQQQSECKLWGWAEPGKKILVVTPWDKKSYPATARKDGYFQVTVKTPEAGGPYTISFKDGDVVTLNNVMIGEVWICSGQSNMEMQMKGFKQQPVEGTTEELLRCKDNQLRLFTVKRHASLTPEKDVTGQWSEATTASVRDFSATAYYFGRALRQALGVPVGLICTSWGGSACEAWMNADWLKAFPKVKQTITDEDVKKLQQRCPTALYNGQLKPLIGYGMRGAIWYQGEDNVPRYDFYAPLLKAMVEGWRSDWKQGEFPFYYCQIAPYDYSLIQWEGSQYLREQQAKAESMIANARMAVLMDAGLEYGIHPRKKRQAGERLALLALANTYDVKGLPDFAVYKEVVFQNDTAVVSFDRSKEWVYFEHGTTSNNFEVAGADRVFHPASKVWVSRNRVYITCDQVKKPVAVRYAFKDWADGDLMHDGLPVSSFRSDDWEKLPAAPSTSKEDYNNPK
ncbi:sialate O-acetylesterase [Prevotella sp. tc2-28]|uniref:sialate O-acetylesterase n=1 Tax=Prevotella sp. tc2-28 TaxID=1761888 RepID=UPI00089450AC|nr:sialate O-acetylesterase [Prevotella sp. tc2-28]SEA44687.1 sialate O-acetylesterase [Prevotella sp. tc2-28]